MSILMFQSARPVRDAKADVTYADIPTDVSIRAPREGRDNKTTIQGG